LCRRLDRRLLQLEAEGWIFYKHKKPSTGGLGGALLELQKTVSPSARQIVAVHDEAETGEDQASESSPKILPRRLDR